MREDVSTYCAALGADPLLVQGAGGNVSWKDGGTLWIKASGTWLADAARKDIFVPVDLAHLRAATAGGDLDVQPRTLGESTLRPSIETLLHALMPQRVVVHVHAIELLAHLVRPDFSAIVTRALGDSVRWAAAPYCKPGLALAQAVAAALRGVPDAQAVFLQNHGVVVGGDSCAEVDAVLRLMLERLSSPPASALPAARRPIAGYEAVADEGVAQLAVDPALFARLAKDWALFPDHVVFLGARAHTFDSPAALAQAQSGPDLAFVRGEGVYARGGLTAARLAQLRCYYDVLARVPAGAQLASLGERQVGELLNWDAEQYRMALAN